MLSILDENLLWNERHLNLRTESENDVLGESISSVQNYNNLPFPIASKFPLKGTKFYKTAHNKLKVTQATNVYMLRNPEWGNWNKEMDHDGWEATGMKGDFVGKSSLEIYKRFFKPGTYEMDATSALYLFEDGNVKDFLYFSFR